MLTAVLVLVGVLGGAIFARLLPQFIFGRYNVGVFGYASNGVAALLLALLALLAVSIAGAAAVAGGGAVAVLLRIGEDYGRSSLVRRSLGGVDRRYWLDVVESLRYVALAVFFLALLAVLYAGVFRLVWGDAL